MTRRTSIIIFILLTMTLFVFACQPKQIQVTQTMEEYKIVEEDYAISGEIVAINEVIINGYSFPLLTLMNDGHIQDHVIDLNAINYEVGRQILFFVTNTHWHGLLHVVTGGFIDNMPGKSPYILLGEFPYFTSNPMSPTSNCSGIITEWEKENGKWNFTTN